MSLPERHRLLEAAEALRGSHPMAFTGAGMSVQSGIPPFRGPGGLWTTIDPALFEIGAFRARPLESWRIIKEIFFDTLGRARPNAGHEALSRLERAGRLSGIVTQNIDGLHQAAGSRVVYEFHGNMRRLRCLECGRTPALGAVSLEELPPRCPACGGLLKPDFIFFGEAIPAEVQEASLSLARFSKCCLVVGSTGEVYPAAYIPQEARRHGATIVEINVRPSHFTDAVTDIFLQGPAAETLAALAELLGGCAPASPVSRKAES